MILFDCLGENRLWRRLQSRKGRPVRRWFSGGPSPVVSEPCLQQLESSVLIYKPVWAVGVGVPLKLPPSPGIDPRARGTLKDTALFPAPGGGASGTARLSLPLPAGTGGASLLY